MSGHSARAEAGAVRDDVIREDGFVMTDCRASAGWMGTSHLHEHDEAFYVLAGALTVDVGGERLVAAKYNCVLVPGGEAHAVANLAREETRWLTVCTPPPAVEMVVGSAAGGGPARRVNALPGGGKVLGRGREGRGRAAIRANMMGGGHKAPPLHYHSFDEAF